jgi:putative toxin-antitoxin system antitoxin component (TIGR02293 family)
MELSSIGHLLGGEKVLKKQLRTRMDLIELSRQGLTKDALMNLATHLSLSLRQIADLLPVTERTLQRYGRRQHFNPAISEQILQVAEVVARGTEVFGDPTRFQLWLHQPNTALAGQTPFSLLCSRFGTEMVLDELGRIEHGVFA